MLLEQKSTTSKTNARHRTCQQQQISKYALLLSVLQASCAKRCVRARGAAVRAPGQQPTDQHQARDPVKLSASARTQRAADRG